MSNEKNETFEEILKDNKVLVSIETVKIKDFIFSTNKLKLIRGASYLLDYMNQVEVPRILEKYKMKFNGKELVNSIYDEKDDDKFLKKIDEEIDKYIDKRILYIGAGNAKFLVGNEKIAEEICKEIKEIYKKMAPSSKVVAEFRKIGDSEKIWDAIDELSQKTAEKKSEGFPILNIDLPFAVKCDLSGSEVAVVSWNNCENDLEKINIHQTGEATDNDNQKKDTNNAIKNVIVEDKLKISEESAVKIKFSNKMIKDDINEIGFYSIIKKALQDDIYLNAEIDDYISENNFIGFMYSDGDGLGDFLKNIKKVYTTEEKYMQFMRKFSIILDRNTKYVLKEVLVDLYKNKAFSNKVNKKTVIGEFLIVGGDDVCAVFPADLAIEISSKFQKQFEEKMKKFMEKENEGVANNVEKNRENITSSSGVIIAKAKTPMFQLFDQALVLQKSAKLQRYNENKIRTKDDIEKNYKTGYIDFQVIGSEGNVDIKEYRKNNNWYDKSKKDKDKDKGIYVSKRPYSINMVSEEISCEIETLIEKIKILKKQNFPKTKIRYIYDMKKDKNKTENEKVMEVINVLSKMSEEEVKFLEKNWQIKEKLKINFDTDDKNIEKVFDKVFEDIFDILEMYDFIREDNKKVDEGGE